MHPLSMRSRICFDPAKKGKISYRDFLEKIKLIINFQVVEVKAC